MSFCSKGFPVLIPIKHKFQNRHIFSTFLLLHLHLLWFWFVVQFYLFVVYLMLFFYLIWINHGGNYGLYVLWRSKINERHENTPSIRYDRLAFSILLRSSMIHCKYKGKLFGLMIFFSLRCFLFYFGWVLFGIAYWWHRIMS